MKTKLKICVFVFFGGGTGYNLPPLKKGYTINQSIEPRVTTTPPHTKYQNILPLKNRFRLAIIVPGKCKYILLHKNVRTCNYLQHISKYSLQKLSDGFHVVPRIFWWFPLVILGYSRYIRFEYMWNRLRICNYFSRLFQKSSAVAVRYDNHEVTRGITKDNQR
jgi:hypothetical protein